MGPELIKRDARLAGAVTRSQQSRWHTRSENLSLRGTDSPSESGRQAHVPTVATDEREEVQI